MIGSLCYYRYMGYDVVEVKKKEEPENPNEVVHTTAHSRTVLVYKDKDFVPYTTRIYNMFNPSSPSSSSSSSSSSSFVHESGTGAGEE
ncbi:unnamed protein product [Merluccius merluccius]